MTRILLTILLLISLNGCSYIGHPYPTIRALEREESTLFTKLARTSVQISGRCSGNVVETNDNYSLILTAAHCFGPTGVKGVSMSATAVLTDYWGRHFDAVVIAADYPNDLIMLMTLDSTHIVPLKLSPYDGEPYEKVFMVGHPSVYSWSGTAGHLNRLIKFKWWSNFFRKATIFAHAGSSGSSVVNSRMQLVGVLVRGHQAGTLTLLIPWKAVSNFVTNWSLPRYAPKFLLSPILRILSRMQTS